MKTLVNFKEPKIWRMFVVAVVSGFLGVLLYYVNPFFTGYLIDHIIQFKDVDLIPVWLGLAFIFAIFLHSYLFYFLKYLWDKYALLLSNEVRRTLKNRTFEMPIYTYSKFNHSYLLNLIFWDSATVGGVTLTYIASSLLAVLRIVACIIILWFINSKLTLISLLFLPAYAGAMLLNRSRLQNTSMQERKLFDSLIFNIKKLIEGKSHINLYQQESYFDAKFNQQMGNWTSKKLQYSLWFNLTKEIPQFISTVAPVTVLAIGARLVIQDSMTLGRLIMFSQYVNMLFEPLNILAQAFVEKKATLPIFQRVKDYLFVTHEKEGASFSPSQNSEQLIAIENYHVLKGDGEILLKIPKLQIRKQGLYVFSGDNGVGKSTILNLLTSVSDPNLLQPHGTDASLHLASGFLEKIGYLYQPGFLFEGTVRENITFGMMQPDRLQSISDLLLLPDLEKEISFNPVNLSLGEQQKVFLGRILFQDREVILLDEPLTNLDFEIKERVRSYIQQYKNQKTFLIVTHDPRLKELADTIFEIKDRSLTVISQ